MLNILVTAAILVGADAVMRIPINRQAYVFTAYLVRSYRVRAVACLLPFFLSSLHLLITCAFTGCKASRERRWVLRVFPDIPVNGAQLCTIALPLISFSFVHHVRFTLPPPWSSVLPLERAGTTPLPRRRSQSRTLRMPSTTARFRLVPRGNRLLSFSTLDQATSGSVSSELASIYC